ncbi:MAG: hypothetical protein ACK5NK_08785 [Niabella sp.]
MAGKGELIGCCFKPKINRNGYHNPRFNEIIFDACIENQTLIMVKTSKQHITNYTPEVQYLHWGKQANLEN